jgi:hypothetical protein
VEEDARVEDRKKERENREKRKKRREKCNNNKMKS